MAKFAVSYFSLHYNEMRMKISEADSRALAIAEAMNENGYEFDIAILEQDEEQAVEALKEEAFNCDVMFDAIQVADATEVTGWK